MPAPVQLGSLGARGFVFRGPGEYALLGIVSAAGDVNRDGIDDFIVAGNANDATNQSSGNSYVIYGRADGQFGAINLAALSASQGFRIHGAPQSAGSNLDVASAGDFNGDGYDDIVIGGVNNSNGNCGAWLVFGGPTGTPTVELGTLTASQGFAILGARNDSTGFSVSSAGDINHDGYDDIILGSPDNNAGADFAGRAHVIFGKASGFGTVNLASFSASDGFVISGDASHEFVGYDVTALGDVNGDGIDDLAVSAPFADESGVDTGAVYLIYGRTTGFGASVNLAALGGADGAILRGGERIGWSVSGAGDVNADGYDDLIVGAPLADGVRGRAYVVFGKAGGIGSLDVTAMTAAQGFAIVGINSSEWAGHSVSAAGDIDGDGFDDLLLSAPFDSSGVSYLIFGKASFGTINLADIRNADTPAGFSLLGQTSGDAAGRTLSTAGDVNDDGVADILIGSRDNYAGGYASGASYLVLGLLPTTAVVRTGTIAGQHLTGGDFNDQLFGLGGDDVLYGNGGNDLLEGGVGDDILKGGAGDDVIDPGSGQDQAYGGSGDDSFRLSALSIGLPDSSFDGGDGFDTFDCSVAASSLFFSSDSQEPDVFHVLDNRGQGIERVIGGSAPDIFSFAYFASGIEAHGGLGNDSFSGGSGHDSFFGEGGADSFTVDPGDHADGGEGDDQFFISGAFGVPPVNGAVIGGSGEDLLKLNISFTVDLEAGTAVSGAATYAVGSVESVLAAAWLGYHSTVGGSDADETLAVNPLFDDGSVGVAFDGRGGNDRLTGSISADDLRGSAGNDVIDGRAGQDMMTGGLGDDLFVVDNAGDRVIEAANEGVDEIRTDLAAFSLAGTNVENLTGLGAVNQALTGNDGANVINGGAGADTMTGGGGDDSYYVDEGGDVVVEAAGGGRDVIYAGLSYVLGADAEVEVLSTSSLAGTASINLTGNELAQEIYGNAGANFLNGGGGADLLIGLGGDDQYFITSGSEQIIETAGNGRDVVYAAVSHALGAGASIEVLSTTSDVGTASINLTGNELAQEIYGNAGANTLNGGGGADLLIGLGGDDAYFITSGAEQIIEQAGQGRDVVYASVSHALGAGVSIEILSTTSLVGTASINLTGNELAQEIYGNAGSNILNGGGGADLLIGGGGDDSYYITSGSEQVIEQAGQGRDVVYAVVSHALGAGVSIEVLSAASLVDTNAINLTGNELAQEIYGNAGSNILNGGGGADLLIGGGGDDVYYITGGAEQIVESSGNGRDVAYATTSYALGVGVSIEVLSTASLGGTSAINLTGNELAQEVYGNAGANLLNGGAGNDYLQGFGGADSFAFTTTPSGANVDTIADMVSGTDRILLVDAAFTGLTPGALSSNAFVIGAAAQDADDRIVYNNATGQLFFDADGNGSGAAVLFATLQGAPVLNAGDFTVI